MNDNDLIKRGEVLNHLGDLFTLCSETGSITERDLENFGKIIKSLSPVPQEMSAVEYLKEKARTKATLLEECKKRVQCREPNCHICQWSYRDRVPDGNFERKNPQQAVAIVEEWAWEHPEEVNDAD